MHADLLEAEIEPSALSTDPRNENVDISFTAYPMAASFYTKLIDCFMFLCTHCKICSVGGRSVLEAPWIVSIGYQKAVKNS